MDHRTCHKCVGLACIIMVLPTAAVHSQVVLSGNENKISLTSGAPRFVEQAEPDSLSIIDLSAFPPNVRHILGIDNTVIGPPSNIAVAPDGRVALLANSLTINRQASPDPWEPARDVSLLDLTSDPPAIVATVQVGRQPSGISIAPDGQTALVANRADGTISCLTLSGHQLRVMNTVAVCEPADSVSDVAIGPQGRIALASVQKGGYLAVLQIEDERVTLSDDRVSVYGQPYRVVITPDGALGLTAGQGVAENGVDADALSIVDMTTSPVRTIDYVALGAVPESIEVSPDGRWLAAVLMAGSNFPPEDPRHRAHGELVLLRRTGTSYRVVERHPVGRIPEGVAFSADGSYLLVQSHPEREIWMFRMTDQGAVDTKHRIAVPGMPSSLRAAPGP